MVRSCKITNGLAANVPAGAVNVIVPEFAANPPAALVANSAAQTTPVAPAARVVCETFRPATEPDGDDAGAAARTGEGSELVSD